MNENILVQKNEETMIPEITVSEFNYSGYQVVRGEFFSHLFEPSITFNNEKISVNSACINKLSDAEYVQILVNPTEKKLAVKPCSEDIKDSFCWVSKTPNGKRKPKTITCKVFFAKVMNLMGWDPFYRYKILGKLIRTPSETLFVFDLTSAETYLKKTEDGNERTRVPIYPEEWKNQFGTPANEHQDSVLIEIFDDYAVFRIDKDEEKRGITNDCNDNVGSEEEEDTNTSEDAGEDEQTGLLASSGES